MWTQEVPKEQNTGVHYPSDFVRTPDYETLEEVWPVKEHGLLVWAYGHQHIGAVHMQLWHERNPKNYADEIRNSTAARPFQPTEMICETAPTYGNGTLKEKGNEKGYVVAISTCSFEQGWELRQGDTLRVMSKYYTRPKYSGVMSYMNVLVAPLTDTDDTIGGGRPCEQSEKCMRDKVWTKVNPQLPGPLHAEMPRMQPWIKLLEVGKEGQGALKCDWAVNAPTLAPVPVPASFGAATPVPTPVSVCVEKCNRNTNSNSNKN